MKKPTKRSKKMKRLGAGYIWFGKETGPMGAYTHVSLFKRPNGGPDNPLVELKLHDLGAWKKVRLWAEVLE